MYPLTSSFAFSLFPSLFLCTFLLSLEQLLSYPNQLKVKKGQCQRCRTKAWGNRHSRILPIANCQLCVSWPLVGSYAELWIWLPFPVYSSTAWMWFQPLFALCSLGNDKDLYHKPSQTSGTEARTAWPEKCVLQDSDSINSQQLSLTVPSPLLSLYQSQTHYIMMRTHITTHLSHTKLCGLSYVRNPWRK